jgi:hypothetical protein
MKTMEEWWRSWIKFLFHTTVEVFGSSSEAVTRPQLIFSLIEPISRSKYPAISAEEQSISVPLQILCLAVLDCVFIHILTTVAPLTWRDIKQGICQALIHGKEQGVCRIISQAYLDIDVFFLQESSAILVHRLHECPPLEAKFAVLVPRVLDSRRNQNSLILVDRARFRAPTSADVTADVLALLGGAFVSPGDLHAVSIEDVAGRRWLLASFHGDSNGLSTQPVLACLHQAARARFPDHVLLVGADANTQSVALDSFHRGVEGFRKFLRDAGMLSSWDAAPAAPTTTCSARSFLQPQPHKAVLHAQRLRANRHLKDWLIAYDAQVLRVRAKRRAFEML